MRKIIITLSIAMLSACATSEPTVQTPNENEVDQTVCEDAWECWCNTFKTKATCNAAVQGGRHCFWEAPALAVSDTNAAAPRCHATYE